MTPTSATVDNEEDEAPVCETDLDETDGGDMPDAPAERTPSERYGLRKKVNPPPRKAILCGHSRRASLRGGVMLQTGTIELHVLSMRGYQS